MVKDYYSILGVEKTASEDELKKAYRSLSKKYHPDLQQGKSEFEKKDAEEKFKEINEAYSILSDAEKRQKYDTFGTADPSSRGFGPGGFDPMSFFRSHFSSHFNDFSFGFGAGHSHRPSRPDPNAPKDGHDVEIGIQLSFEEAIFGTTREFDIKFKERCQHCKGTGSDDGKEQNCDMCGGSGMYTKMIAANFMSSVTCPKCHGRGTVPSVSCHVCGGSGVAPVSHHINIHIPAGIDTGERLKVPEEGEHGLNGGANGNLFITVQVGESELFERWHNNLVTTVYVPSIAIGILDTVDVQTPYGVKSVQIPESAESDGVFVAKLVGYGIKRHVNGMDAVGDLTVRIVPEPISNMTSEQKKMAKALFDSLGDRNRTGSEKKYTKMVEIFKSTAEKLGQKT